MIIAHIFSIRRRVVKVAYISSFVYCDNIQQGTTADNKPMTHILNPLQVLSPDSLPGNFSFSIMCNISGFDAEQENVFNLQFISPIGEVIQNTGDIPIKLPVEVLAQQKKPNAMQMCMDFRNVVIREYGEHVTVIRMNDDVIGEFRIPVIEGD